MTDIEKTSQPWHGLLLEMRYAIDIDLMSINFEHCKASAKLAAQYIVYKYIREQKAHHAAEEEDGDGNDVSLTITYFKSGKEHIDVADFDWSIYFPRILCTSFYASLYK